MMQSRLLLLGIVATGSFFSTCSVAASAGAVCGAQHSELVAEGACSKRSLSPLRPPQASLLQMQASRGTRDMTIVEEEDEDVPKEAVAPSKSTRKAQASQRPGAATHKLASAQKVTMIESRSEGSPDASVATVVAATSEQPSQAMESSASRTDHPVYAVSDFSAAMHLHEAILLKRVTRVATVLRSAMRGRSSHVVVPVLLSLVVLCVAIPLYCILMRPGSRRQSSVAVPRRPAPSPVKKVAEGKGTGLPSPLLSRTSLQPSPRQLSSSGVGGPGGPEAHFCPEMLVPESSECFLMFPSRPRTPEVGPITVTDSHGGKVLTITLQKRSGSKSCPWTNMLLVTHASGKQVAECQFLPGNTFGFYTRSGELYGSMSPTSTSNAHCGQCVLTTKRGLKFFFKGSTRQHSLCVTDASGAILAECNGDQVEFDRTCLYWGMRMAPHTEVAMVICGILCMETLTELGDGVVAG